MDYYLSGSTLDADPLPGNGSRAICQPWLHLQDNVSINTTAIIAMFSIRIISSSLSLLGTASVIVISLISRSMTNSEVHPIFMLSLADFLVAALWLVGSAVFLQDSTHIGLCYYSGMFTTVFEIVSFFLTASYAIIVFMSIREVFYNGGNELPLKDKRKIPRYIFTILLYLISWLVPFVAVIGPVLATVDFSIEDKCCKYCEADLSSLRAAFRNCTGGIDGKVETYKFDLVLSMAFVLTFFTTFVTMLVFYFLTTCLVYRLQEKFRPEFDQTNKDNKKVRRILLRITLFGLIYLMCGLPTIVASGIVWRERSAVKVFETPDIFILIWQAVFTPLQGFLNSLAYGWTRRAFRRVILCGGSSCCRRQTPQERIVRSLLAQPSRKNYDSLKSSRDHNHTLSVEEET